MLPVKCNIKCRLLGHVSLLSTLGGPIYDNRFMVGILKKQKGINFNVMIAPRYCREALIHHFNQHIRQLKVMTREPLYLVIYQNMTLKQPKFHGNLDKSIVILNSMERKAGWTLTRKMDLFINEVPINKVSPWVHQPDLRQPSTCTAVIKCDYRWTKAPFMFSLLLLILRSSADSVVETTKIENEKDVSKFKRKLKLADHKDYRLSSDSDHIRRTLACWMPLTKHYSKIFKGVTKKQLWHHPNGKTRYVGIEAWLRKANFINMVTALTRKRAESLIKKSPFRLKVEGR